MAFRVASLCNDSAKLLNALGSGIVECINLQDGQKKTIFTVFSLVNIVMLNGQSLLNSQEILVNIFISKLVFIYTYFYLTTINAELRMAF